MSDTPRTDAFFKPSLGPDFGMSDAKDFARQLERESKRLREALEKCEKVALQYYRHYAHEAWSGALSAEITKIVRAAIKS